MQKQRLTVKERRELAAKQAHEEHLQKIKLWEKERTQLVIELIKEAASSAEISINISLKDGVLFYIADKLVENYGRKDYETLYLPIYNCSENEYYSFKEYVDQQIFTVKERKRKEEIKAQALSKLTQEEKEILFN